MKAAALLGALQWADGQFPSGGFAFSWGIESLAADGLLTRRDWACFLAGQFAMRWSGFDRLLAAHAHAHAGDLDATAEIDDIAEAFSLIAAAREGSRRAGAALLGTHARLKTPSASAYRTRVREGRARGHLPVVQGLVLAGAGMDRDTSLAIIAHSSAQALCSAAIRLGLISALDAQAALIALRPELTRALEAAIPPLDDIQSFTPLADIAMMRHPLQPQQLFSN